MEPKKTTDWFTVEHKFTVTNAEELHYYLQAAAEALAEELDRAVREEFDEDCAMAQSMLAEIGVKV